MGPKFRIILGIVLVLSTAYQIDCASLKRNFRLVRDVEDQDITTTTPINHSSPEIPSKNSHYHDTQDDITKVDKGVNKITQTENVETNLAENNKNETENTDVNQTKDKNDVIKTEEPKGTGRSLNINIEKYVSPEFHNKNNVYSMPTSPEIEKFLEPNSHEYTDEVTVSTKKSPISRTTNIEYSFDLTTPSSNIFDSKFQLMVDGIKQNLDEIIPNRDQFENDDKSSNEKYDVSKLIENYKNADNNTDIALEAKEYKNINLNMEESGANKDMESGKNVNYESRYFKSNTFGDDPENSDGPVANNIPYTNEKNKSIDNENEESESMNKVVYSTESQHNLTTTLKPITTTYMLNKKPKFQISLRNNTIETTAPDSDDIKSKSIKYFTSDSSLDPLYETFTKSVFENAINISKRGSTKLVGNNDGLNTATTSSFMDYDNKNFTIPPSATAWTLVSLREVPTSTSTSNLNDTEGDQNSQENSVIKTQLTPSTKKDDVTTDVPNSTENDLISTTKFLKIASSNEKTTTQRYESETTTNTKEITTYLEELTEKLSHTINNMNREEDKTTEGINLTVSSEESTINSVKLSPDSDITTEQVDETTENTTFNLKSSTNSEFSTTFSQSTDKFASTTEIIFTTEPTIYRDTTVEYMTSTITEKEEFTTEDKHNYETTESSAYTSDVMKYVPPKTESENELFTTTSIESNITDLTSYETTTQIPRISASSSALPAHDEEIDNNFENGDNDYSEITFKKEKNATDANDPDIEMLPIDNEQESRTRQNDASTKQMNVTVSPATNINEHKSISEDNNDVENSTIGATSSTELLSHDDSTEDNNSGMIAAIAISSVGGICLILLAGLLLIMRKRQKRVTYGQRCRPVSLDAYSLDNVSVYNSVRRKGALRASKRSYGNPAFDDPVSVSHQMNFQALAKFAENSEEINTEFDEIPQVTARANEVPAGCETKNRYANVIPLPETRVFLKAFDNDPHSDYINANYVTGPKNTRSYYIACQGPLQSTVDDFWRMVWEQQSRVILMLTNLYENGIEKCADYLPPSEVLDCHRLFGDFQITLKKREVKEKYIISSLQLKNMVSNSWREVTHLWYLGWPERGVPTEANSLIAFLIEARSHLKNASNNNTSNDKTTETNNLYISNASGAEGGPMIVHCSPGTGRTGTVIACDIAIRDFELTRSVDVPRIVYRIRRDRASAVQTRDQYAFIYKVISVYATKLTGGALDSI